MKDIDGILKEFGLEIPEDKVEEFKKTFNANYKTIAEHTKLKDEIVSLKSRAESAETTLKGFEGIDKDAYDKQIAEYEKKLADAQSDYEKKIYDRDFSDALAKEMANIKFTSKSAGDAVKAKIQEYGITLKDGKLFGFNDALNAIKESDADAFVNEDKAKLEQSKVQFTTPTMAQTQTITKESIMSIKDRGERQKAIKENPSLFS